MSLGLALIQCRPRPPAMTYLINTFVVTFAFLRCGSGPKVDWGMRCSIACVSSDRERERGGCVRHEQQHLDKVRAAAAANLASAASPGQRFAPRFFIVANEIWLCRAGIQKRISCSESQGEPEIYGMINAGHTDCICQRVGIKRLLWTMLSNK